MRVLVIGADGFLGTHVVRRARHAGMEVVTADRRADGASEHTVDLANGPLPLAALLDALAPDGVVNCAGATAGSAEELTEGNVSAVFNVLVAMDEARWHGRFVHLGSGAEYGRTPVGSSVDEGAPARPVSIYGATKLGGTRLVEFARRHGHDAVVLRVFNPLGVGAPEAGLPGRLVAQVRRACVDGDPIHLGPLDAVRDFIDARDVGDAVVATMVSSGARSAVLNVGSGHGVPARAIVDELLAISGCASEVVLDEPGSSRSADVPWSQADVRRAEREVGWKPQHDLHATLSDWWRELP
jgi:nucleoside-diphosphate-sugar epimerase